MSNKSATPNSEREFKTLLTELEDKVKTLLPDAAKVKEEIFAHLKSVDSKVTTAMHNIGKGHKNGEKQ